jgi:hypothetical protein
MMERRQLKSLKLQIVGDQDYDRVIARYRAEKLGDGTQDMRIVPVNFNSEHKAMLGHCKMILEQDPRKIAINPDRVDKLIIAVRTAVDNDGTLDKVATSYNEVFDAFRLALKWYPLSSSFANCTAPASPDFRFSHFSLNLAQSLNVSQLTSGYSW